ncbi:hypothetical protein M3Y98_00968900 [Aphelenchoides besseyi]|nr:hypothetical protein M3Y98_00968900 [Aphelenchoides besseyi]
MPLDSKNGLERALLEFMPDFYAIEVQKLMNSENYERKCFDRNTLLNKAYLYPFICLARRKCSVFLTDAYYALIYANQQMALETNDQLECNDQHDQDLRSELYSKGYVFKRGHVLSRHFCRGVSIPPRRSLHEHHSTDGFKIIIGLEYFW